MVNEQVPSPPSADQIEIHKLIESWIQAVRDQDLAGISRNHAPDILMFDVPPPFQSRGIDQYMATWDTFFASVEKPVQFHFTDMEITAGTDVAFATAIGHCVAVDSNGQREPVRFRLTMGLRKEDGRWQIKHEHHSVPAE